MLFENVPDRYLKRDWGLDKPEDFPAKYAAEIGEKAELHDNLGTMQGWRFWSDPQVDWLDAPIELVLFFQHAFVVYTPGWEEHKVYEFLRFDEEATFNPAWRNTRP